MRCNDIVTDIGPKSTLDVQLECLLKAEAVPLSMMFISLCYDFWP